MKYIVAGNFRQAINFAKAQGWGRTKWRYIPSADKTFGLFAPDVWRVGTFTDNRNWAEINAALSARGAIFHDG